MYVYTSTISLQKFQPTRAFGDYLTAVKVIRNRRGENVAGRDVETLILFVDLLMNVRMRRENEPPHLMPAELLGENHSIGRGSFSHD